MLGPGETADVDLTLVIGDKLGEVVHEAEVITDLPSAGSIVLRTSAVAFPRFRVEEISGPSKKSHFERSEPFRVEYRAIASGTATDILPDLDRVELRSIEKAEWIGSKDSFPEEGGLKVESRRFVALLKCEALGEHKGEIIFLDGERTLHAHGENWDVISPITVSPKMIVIRAGKTTPRILLRSRDQRPFRVLRVECGLPWLRGRATKETIDLTQVVEIDGEPPKGQAPGVVSVVTDHPGQGKVVIPFLVIE